MPYLSCNISSSIFYGSMPSEFLRIAWCTLRPTNFVSKVSQLHARMVTQAGNKASILRHIKKHSKDTMKHFPVLWDEVIIEINMY